MLEVTDTDILARLAYDNPWWETGESTSRMPYRNLPQRDYFQPFHALAENRTVRRAVILLGPRRVGKTVMLYQHVEQLLKKGTPGTQILFLSIETPILTGIPLDRFVELFKEQFNHAEDAPLTLIFDEVQYLKDWERHLKVLVDRHCNIRFIASGSAAAALRLKSQESGAGRFTEFLLPPLTFAEFLRFTDREDSLISARTDESGRFTRYRCLDMSGLNEEFMRYLNYGGYPEAVFNDSIQEDAGRFIKSDIIDKVLLRDLPQLYGISDVQELNRLFTTLAYNTANEVSFESLGQKSGVSKATLARYIEYLEAAYLIRRVYRIDQNARHFERARTFKVYLANPSMRAALFGSQSEDDATMGALAETALFSQWFHSQESAECLYYGRWPTGEIDMIYLDPSTQAPIWCVEVKWSDVAAKDPRVLNNLVSFGTKFATSLTRISITTRTVHQTKNVKGVEILFVPTSLRVYTVAKNVVKRRSQSLQKILDEDQTVIS